MYGELDYDDAAEAWIGFNDTFSFEIAREAMIEAYHIMTMRGVSRNVYYLALKDTDTWLNDPTLRDLDGVAITAR